MKMSRWILLLMLGFSAAGCPPLSLYPLYEQADIVTDDRLLGAWSAGDVLWTARRVGNEYLVIRDQGEVRTRFRAILTRLGGHVFMDLTPYPAEDISGRYEHHVILAHSISRVSFVGDTLKLDMLTNIRPDSVQAARGNWIPFEDEYQSSDDILITAPTARLRAFLQEHAEDPNLYGKQEYVRLAREQRSTEEKRR